MFGLLVAWWKLPIHVWQLRPSCREKGSSPLFQPVCIRLWGPDTGFLGGGAGLLKIDLSGSLLTYPALLTNLKFHFPSVCWSTHKNPLFCLWRMASFFWFPQLLCESTLQPVFPRFGGRPTSDSPRKYLRCENGPRTLSRHPLDCSQNQLDWPQQYKFHLPPNEPGAW